MLVLSSLWDLLVATNVRRIKTPLTFWNLKC